MSVPGVCPELLRCVPAPIPRYFAHDLMQRLASDVHAAWKGFRDYWPSLFVGSPTVESALHTDWCDTGAWMGMLHGEKRWAIVPAAEARRIRMCV